MSIRMMVVAVALLAIATNDASAQLGDAGAAPASPEAAASRPVVQPAPGGGDMIVLGPESRYVTRAWRDDRGRVHGACRRDPIGTGGQATTREQP